MRFLLFLLAVAAFCISLHLVGLYGFVSYEQFSLQLDTANRQSVLAHIPHLALTPLRYASLRVFAVLGILVGGVGSWWLGRGGAAQLLVAEAAAAARSIKAGWNAISRWEQAVAMTVLLAIGIARTWFLLRYPFSADEAATYDYFVRCGPRVAAAFYALPNNHILYSLLSWPVVHSLSSFADSDLLVRLPSFGLGLATTALAYAGLARLSTWRIATLTTGLFQLSPMVVQYAVSARGYGLQAACVQALFLAALVLWRGSRYQRLAYAVMIAASLCGFYLIPTFAYPFLSIVGALIIVLVASRRWQETACILLASAGIAMLVGMLYLPVGLVSGWAALLHNPYVLALDTAEFWAGFVSYYLYGTVAELWGQPKLSIPVLLVLMVAGPWFASKLVAPIRRVTYLAAWALLLPWLLVVVQRVYAPARTLHYLLFFWFVLAAVAFEVVVKRGRIRSGIAGFMVVVAIATYATHRLQRESQVMEPGQRQMALYRRHSSWLSARRAQRVLADANVRGQYYLYHYTFKTAWPVKVIEGFLPTSPPAGYDHLLLSQGTQLPPWAVQHAAQLVAEDDDSRLYVLQP